MLCIEPKLVLPSLVLLLFGPVQLQFGHPVHLQRVLAEFELVEVERVLIEFGPVLVN